MKAILWLLAMIGTGAFRAPAAESAHQSTPRFRAGAAIVDVGPTGFPVRVNAMFTERSASRITDPLTARALALNDGARTLVICVVDSCMIPRDQIDTARLRAAALCGIEPSHILISATHTHSAPSAMGCLGSRVDPAYAAMLPGRMALAIAQAVSNLQPAQIAWRSTDDWDHTFNRRWIRRPDRLLNDPFGQPSVRANMHPGHRSPDVTGPSGPVDPGLTILAVATTNGVPLAILANYSMHYYGSDLLSSDYYGRFARHLGERLGVPRDFVGIMSQGTSGDLMWMNYGAARKDIGYDAYAREVADRVAEAYQGLRWTNLAPLTVAETNLTLNYRVPDPGRLAWAQAQAAKLGNRLPQTHPEIYALEALHLHERQRIQLRLQAMGIGGLGIAALPNEVFALTGLKLKAASPFPTTMNIELANGAEGYIPPPEQHALGGYTTWPARTAGLEVAAEPQIVAVLTGLLEAAAGRPRRQPQPPATDYSRAVAAANPMARWRFEEMAGPNIADTTGRHPGTIEPGVALYLPGFDEPTPPRSDMGRALHFAGGRMRAEVPLGDSYTVEFWMWNGLPHDARAVTGYAISRGPSGDRLAAGEHLGVGGTHRGDVAGRLIVFNGNRRDQLLAGRTVLAVQAWHHVALVREGDQVRVYLDGRTEPDISGLLPHTVPAGEHTLFVGGRSDGLFGWEGKLDEVAVYGRALAAAEIAAHHRASGAVPPRTTPAPRPAPLTPPLSPRAAVQTLHVPNGFGVECVAHEPLTMDPVAIDWDLAGRLWVAEMADYPLGMDGRGQPGGRIRILTDTNHDGRYDTSVLFAADLNFPNGLLTWRDGVIVTAAPDILFLRDTNHDGRMDVREVLVTGLSQGNQQLRANGLRWGLDNWVYCAAGGHHGGHAADTRLQSSRAGITVAVGSRDFRFRPDTGALEAESGPSQFGRNRDDWGHWFGTQNSRALWHYVLPDRYLRRHPYSAAPDPTHLVVTPLNPQVWPVSRQEKRFHSFNEAGHFTSACSGMIYRDELLFGRAGGGLHAFTCEPFHNLVQHNIVTSDGVTFASHRSPDEVEAEFFSSEDRWCRPVMTRTGPDGALWVVDMYRYMIEHPQWLPENGRAELLPHYRAGDDRGRIYRVFPAGRPLRAWQPLTGLTPVELLDALDSPNEWKRDKAHQALNWTLPGLAAGDRAATLNRLRERLARTNQPLARVHLGAVAEAAGALRSEDVVALLADPHPRVRENAVRLAERFPDAAVVGAALGLAEDPDAKVRLQLALSAGEWPRGIQPDPGPALARLAARDHANPFVRAALLSSAHRHGGALGRALADAGDAAWTALADDLIAVALGLNDEAMLGQLMAPALVPAQGRFTGSQLESLARLLNALGRRPGADATPWTSRAGPALAFARAAADDESMNTAVRTAAVRLLLTQAGDREDAMNRLDRWLAPQQPAELSRAAVELLAASGDASVPRRVERAWAGLSPATRIAAATALMSREPWTTALLQQVEDGADVTLDTAQRARLLNHASAGVRVAAARVLGSLGSRSNVVAQFQPALALAGNASRGRQVFAERCLTCHQREGAGRAIGPDLISVVNHPPAKLLASILDPGADVQPGFHGYQATLRDGSEVYGLLEAETGNSLSFKLADGTTQVIARRDLAALRSTRTSLMPEGLEAGLTPQGLADLIAFVKSPPAGAAPATSPAVPGGDLLVGAAAVNLSSASNMPLAGYLESRFTAGQEGELRAVAVVIGQPDGTRIAIVTCDVLWVTRALVDAATAEIERTTGIPAGHVLINATHTHHAPGTAPAHAFGHSDAFAEEVRRGIVKAVQDADRRRGAASLFFREGRERSVGANSRLRLADGSISWLNPAAEAGLRIEPTGPFDPSLPVLDFRDAAGATRALVFNHSTHTIGTRSGGDVRSPGFYGLAAQELERENGGVYSFIEGASGSTHNVRGVPVAEAVERLKEAVLKARGEAVPLRVHRLAARKVPFTFRVRTFDDATEDAAIARYVNVHAPGSAVRIRAIFTAARDGLRPHIGAERTTWLQVLAVGDVAVVGVPAEYFTGLGLDIKRRSPFPHTIVAELANDWIGYLPDRAGHEQGGYQTWTGRRSYAEPGTGERVADEAVRLLNELRPSTR